MSTLLAVREVRIKSIMRYHYTFTRMVKLKKKMTKSNAGKDAEKLYHLYIVGGNVK